MGGLVTNYVLNPVRYGLDYVACSTGSLDTIQKTCALVGPSASMLALFKLNVIPAKLEASAESAERLIDFKDLWKNVSNLVSWTDDVNWNNDFFEFTADKFLSLANITSALSWGQEIQLFDLTFLAKVGNSIGQVRFFGFVANVTLNSALRGFLVIGFVSKTATQLLIVFSGEKSDVTRAAGRAALSNGLYAAVHGFAFVGLNPLVLGFVAGVVGLYQTLPEAKSYEKFCKTLSSTNN